MDIAKINFAMTYLTGVVQDWFEVGLNQEDQGILQDWLSNWNLFVDELRRHFGLSDPVCCGNHQTQCPMISLTSKSQSWISSGEFTRELDKESLLN